MNQELLNNLPSELQDLIKQDKYDEALSKASSLSEEQAVATLFLENEFDETELRDIKDILVKLCVELGELKDNKFVNFIKEYKSNTNKNISRRGLIALNNLYAKDVIDDHNLDATDEDGSEARSVLFNSGIYDKDDIQFLVTSYYWLTNPYNVKNMNLGALADVSKNAYPEVVEVANKLKITPNMDKKALRNVIVYDISADEAINGKDSRNYTVRNAKDIKDILHIASSRDSSSSQQRNKIASLAVDISKLSADEKQELFDALGVESKVR